MPPDLQPPPLQKKSWPKIKFGTKRSTTKTFGLEVAPHLTEYGVNSLPWTQHTSQILYRHLIVFCMWQRSRWTDQVSMTKLQRPCIVDQRPFQAIHDIAPGLLCHHVSEGRWDFYTKKGQRSLFPEWTKLGKPSLVNSPVFVNIVQTAFDPSPPSYWTCMLQIFLNDFQKSA